MMRDQSQKCKCFVLLRHFPHGLISIKYTLFYEHLYCVINLYLHRTSVTFLIDNLIIF